MKTNTLHLSATGNNRKFTSKTPFALRSETTPAETVLLHQ